MRISRQDRESSRQKNKISRHDSKIQHKAEAIINNEKQLNRQKQMCRQVQVDYVISTVDRKVTEANRQDREFNWQTRGYVDRTVSFTGRQGNVKTCHRIHHVPGSEYQYIYI